MSEECILIICIAAVLIVEAITDCVKEVKNKKKEDE